MTEVNEAYLSRARAAVDHATGVAGGIQRAQRLDQERAIRDLAGALVVLAEALGETLKIIRP